MKVRATDLKPGDVIRFTDPNSPDVRVTADPEIHGDGVNMRFMGLTLSDSTGAPDVVFAMPFTDVVTSELEVVFRARQNVHPGISTMDDGDDLSRLNAEIQAWYANFGNAGLVPPQVEGFVRRLNKLVNPGA